MIASHNNREKNMKTIEQLEATTIVGNFDSDSELWTACDVFICDVNQHMNDRIRAVKVVDNIAGEDSGDLTESDVLEYAAECKRMVEDSPY